MSEDTIGGALLCCTVWPIALPIFGFFCAIYWAVTLGETLRERGRKP